jgi:HSP20 family molecular chaperone IbpA
MTSRGASRCARGEPEEIAMAGPQEPSMPAGENQDQAASGAGHAERTRARRVHTPATDIYETEQGLVLLIDLPGVVPEAVDVTLEQGVLTVRAHTEDRPPPGYSLVHQEYQSGDFERAFTLSEEVDAGRIEAQLNDGVLRLFVPKATRAEGRRIQARSS